MEQHSFEADNLGLLGAKGSTQCTLEIVHCVYWRLQNLSSDDVTSILVLRIDK